MPFRHSLTCEADQSSFVASPTSRSINSALANTLDSSPRQVAHRRTLAAMFGRAIQLHKAPQDEFAQHAGPAVAQRQGMYEDELLQGTLSSPASPLAKQEDTPAPVASENRTGMPDRLKASLEVMSGFDLSDVRVHRNSDRPAQLGAFAYAHGTDIYLGPGQEHHLPHEAWHVVQQRQGRVQTTLQAKGVAVNDDPTLEREADVMGSNAVGMHSPARTPRAGKSESPQAASLKGVIQRKVGFEFELEATVQTFTSRWNGGYRPLTKRERMLNGAGFHVEADGLPNGNSSWEFVTTAFPEDLAGLRQLRNVLKDIDGIIGLLRNSPLTVGPVFTYNRVDNSFRTFGTPVADRYFTISARNFWVKPQVTAGLSLPALDEVLDSAAGGGVSRLVRDTNTVDRSGKVRAQQPVDAQLGVMRMGADTAIVNVTGQPADAGLRALVTQLIQIIIAGQQPIGATPKTVMRVALGRSDMKAVFATLPAQVRAPYEANPAAFVTLVMNAVTASPGGGAIGNNAPVMSGNLFSDQQYANDPRFNTPSPFTQVTCNQWLTGIATIGGQDLLSAGHYPVRRGFLGRRNKTDVEANELLGSMGALHENLDPANRPVFEIRSSALIYAGLITPYALDYFKYVRYLHNPGGLTESNELTGMGDNNRARIAGFDGRRAQHLRHMRRRALANFNT